MLFDHVEPPVICTPAEDAPQRSAIATVVWLAAVPFWASAPRITMLLATELPVPQLTISAPPYCCCCTLSSNTVLLRMVTWLVGWAPAASMPRPPLRQITLFSTRVSCVYGVDPYVESA